MRAKKSSYHRNPIVWRQFLRQSGVFPKLLAKLEQVYHRLVGRNPAYTKEGANATLFTPLYVD